MNLNKTLRRIPGFGLYPAAARSLRERTPGESRQSDGSSGRKDGGQNQRRSERGGKDSVRTLDQNDPLSAQYDPCFPHATRVEPDPGTTGHQAP